MPRFTNSATRIKLLFRVKVESDESAHFSEDVDALVSTQNCFASADFFPAQIIFTAKIFFGAKKISSENGSPGKDVDCRCLSLAAFCLIRRLLNFCHRWHFPLFNHKLSPRLRHRRRRRLHYETIHPPLSFNLMRRYFRNAAFAGPQWAELTGKRQNFSKE